MNRPLAIAFSALGLAALVLRPDMAAAQLVLPGAGPGTATGAVQPAAPVPSAPKPPPGPVVVKLVGEESVVGKTLMLNGARGKLQIERKDKSALQATLIGVGEKISDPSQACGVDLGGGRPLDLTPAGRPEGVIRLSLDAPSCPLTLDVLDGAVLVRGAGAACTFKDADCRVEARGLWGPAPATFEGQKWIESDRSRADKAVRENFKALIHRTQGKQEIKAVAAEQAGFTSERETVCRDYAREAAHGYCASRYTELRAAGLAARLNRLDGKPEGAVVAAAKPRKPKPKPDAATTVGEVPTSAPALAPAPPPQAAAPARKSLFDIFR
ncbi:hypothetical protein ABEG18_00295 [Alsobacter sp. KACC 23698]|uniref:Uncharacterized protein n=1 Tax=Alsobacter sp. KACC 23698 TaxID=3149229 RepID=A0AAU7JGE6_9HYPH